MKIQSRMAIVALTLLSAAANPLWAQHSDVEFEYDGGMIAVEFGDEGAVFESDFSDVELGPDGTDEPGFGSELDEGAGIDPNDVIGYNVVGPLVFHNGTSFAATLASLTVENNAGPDVVVDSLTVLDSGLIDQADSLGDFHTHIDFNINPAAPVGAYGLLLTLSAFDSAGLPKGIADSDPFYIVFNRGLDEEDFEAAVGEFAAIVPEPASFALALSTLGLAFARRRRRTRS